MMFVPFTKLIRYLQICKCHLINLTYFSFKYDALFLISLPKQLSNSYKSKRILSYLKCPNTMYECNMIF